MATVAQRHHEPRFLLEGVSWQFYEVCLAEIGDRRERRGTERP